jgi:hypothetical protein
MRQVRRQRMRGGIGLLAAATTLLLAGAPAVAQVTTPNEAQYRQWAELQRSRVKARLAMWDSVDWRSQFAVEKAKNRAEEAKRDPKKAAQAPSDATLEKMGESAEKAQGRAEGNKLAGEAKLAALDRMMTADTMAAARANGQSYVVVAQALGEVRRRGPRGATETLENGPLRQGEQIETGADSRVTFLVFDGSWITLGANTVLKAVDTAKQPVWELVKGSLYRQSECVSSETYPSCGGFLRAGGATLGARSREYAVEVAADGSAVVTVLNRDLDLKNPTGAVTTVRASEWVQLTGGVIGKPTAINKNDVERWWFDF